MGAKPRLMPTNAPARNGSVRTIRVRLPCECRASGPARIKGEELCQ
jgi:hypothetical protein